MKFRGLAERRGNKITKERRWIEATEKGDIEKEKENIRRRIGVGECRGEQKDGVEEGSGEGGADREEKLEEG